MIGKRAALLAMALALPAAVQAQSAMDQLLENARYWEGRGRADKAVEAWEKVLLSDPRNVEALLTLGLHYAGAGDDDTARDYLRRLRAVSPSHPGVAQLQQALQVGDRSSDLLEQARALARAGDVEAAVLAYERLFGGAAPPRALALEYYQTLGGTSGGWERARDGLARLAEQNPDAARLRLALARHLTYRESSRREGIATLAELVVEPTVGEDARRAWRQALLWLEASPADARLFEAYQERYPLDQEVADRLAQVRAAAVGPAQRAAYAALEQGDLERAERLFRRLGERPEALVGRALVALRRKEFATARSLLEQVRARVPNRRSLWDEPLRGATFWSLMEEGDAARERKEWAAAEAKYLQAAEAAPAERGHALAALGHLALVREEPEEAVGRFEEALVELPDEPGALQGLVKALVQLGRSHEAAAANERLAATAPERALSADWIASEQLREAAREARARGDWRFALDRLEEAARSAPENEWVFHDQANLHLELGRLEEAREALGQLMELAPELPELRVVQVRLLAAEGATGAALDLLQSIPESGRDAELDRLHRRLELQEEVARIVARGESGDPHFAREELEQVERRIGTDPEGLKAVAAGWARLGDGARAWGAVRQVMSRHAEPSSQLLLELAGILFETDRDRELAGLLRIISRDGKLQRHQQRDLQALRVGHAVRIADHLREEGNHLRAFSHLSPVVQEYPNDPALLCAVARLYRGAGQDEQAHEIYVRVLRQHPDSLDARQGAVETAVALQIHDVAESLSLEGLRLAPDDARLHLVAARSAIAAGDEGQGMELLRRAEALANGTGGPATGAGRALHRDSSSGDILRNASLLFSRQLPAAKGEATTQALLQEIGREIDGLRSRLSVRAGGGPRIRVREGEEGLGHLTAIEVPFELTVPLSYTSEISLHVTPVSASHGPLGSGADVLSRFASGASIGPGTEEGAGGTAAAIAYRIGGLHLDVGSTPLGFPVQNAVGGLEWAWEGKGFGLRLDVERRAVTDSVLSWAGVEDPVSGEVWGGVVRSGGRLDLGFRLPEMLLYVYGGYHLLTGEKVAENRMAEAGAGAEWLLFEDDVSVVHLGLGLGALGYAENQRYFTRGHGGYFSPQAFVRTGVPLRWKGSAGRVRWDVLLDPGINWFQEDEADYFPGDEELQTALQGSVDSDGAPLPAHYEGRTSLAFSLNAEPRLSLEVNDFLQAGVRAALHTAEDYREVSAGLFLQGSFSRKR